MDRNVGFSFGPELGYAIVCAKMLLSPETVKLLFRRVPVRLHGGPAESRTNKGVVPETVGAA